MNTQQAFNAFYDITQQTPHNGYMRTDDTRELFIKMIHEHKAQLKARDEEMELKELRAFRSGFNFHQKGNIGWLKSRSIVAMLFWNYSRTRYNRKNGNKYYTDDMVLEAYSCFLKAYKILKESKCSENG